MQRILVSACLLGHAVRYNGLDKQSDDAVLRRWVDEGRVVSVCPEVAGGLPVPRPPAEIAGGARVPVPGVTTARLLAAGLRVFSEHQLVEADRYLRALEPARSD